MVTPTILQSDFFVNLVLPFLLVFTLVFAILQKTKILGDGKKQIDAIVALVVGLLVVAFGYAVNIIVFLMPVLAVSLVVILLFLLIWGFTHGSEKFEIHKNVKMAGGVIAALVVAIALIYVTGFYNTFLSWFNSDSSYVGTAVFVILMVVGVGVVIGFGGGKSGGKD